MAVDNDSNLPVPIDGSNSANIGTDIYSSSGVTAHAQVMKVAWGNSLNVTRTDESNPLPVRVYGLTGNLATVTVTGAVRGLGTFTVGNTAGSPVFVTGGVNSFVYGVAGATPVSVTGGVYVLGSVGITGAVNVTGGRFLSHTTDTVQVTGSVARGWVLNNADDNVRVWSHAGGTLIPSAIYSSTGVPIGASGNALNVNVIGAGISATVSIGSNVGVENVIGTVLRVQGTANGTAIPVTISGTQTVEVDNSTTNPLFVDARGSQLTIGSQAAMDNFANFNNFERLLIANRPGASVLHTSAQWESFIWDSLGGKPNGTTNVTIQDKLQSILSLLQNNKTSLNYIMDPVVVAKELILPTTGQVTITNAIIEGIDLLAVTKANGFLYQNKTDVPVYLISASYLTSIGINEACKIAGFCPTGVVVVGGLNGTISVSTSATIYQTILNGAYVIPANQSALLPALYTKALITETPTASSVLTITVV